MEPVKKRNFNEAIIYIKILNIETVLIVDSQTTMRYLNIEDLEQKSAFKADIVHSRYTTSVVDFNSDAKKFVSMSSNCKEAQLYYTKAKKLIATVDRHQGEVSCVAIDPQDKYMFSCGDDGKIFAVDITSGHLAITLPAHNDIVSDIAFSDSGDWVATASYDKNIFLFNLSMMAPGNKIKVHSSPVTKLKFLSQDRLFSVDKKSSAIIFDIHSGKVIERLNGIHDDITKVTVGSENKFLFLATKLGYILVYDLNTYMLIDRRYIKLTHAVTALIFDEAKQQLIVGTDDGDLLFYDIFENEGYLNELLKQKKYNIMQDCIEKNPLLEYTQASKIVSLLWERTIEKAKEFLGNNMREKAIKLFDNFKIIPAKKQIMDKLILEYRDFEKFKMLAGEGKIALAYILANAHPLYKETSIYESLEIQWKKTFALAQKYLLDPKSDDRASEVLAPYRGISQKSKLIQDLLLNASLHRRFRIAIGQKDFKGAFELIKQHPFLKDYSEYESLIRYSDSLYGRAQMYLEKGNTLSAIKLFRILLDFEDFKDEVKDIISEIQNRQKFFNMIEDGNLLLAYEILDASDYLHNSKDGKRLQLLWENDLNKANKYASNGDVNGTKTVLEKYMKISSKNIAIASVLSECYISQLKNSIRERKDKKIIETGIKNYILYYGLTEEILDFFEIFREKYSDTKLNLDSQTKGSIDSWRPSMIVPSILL